MGRSARALIVEEFNYDKVIPRLAQIIRETAENAKRGKAPHEGPDDR